MVQLDTDRLRVTGWSAYVLACALFVVEARLPYSLAVVRVIVKLILATGATAGMSFAALKLSGVRFQAREGEESQAAAPVLASDQTGVSFGRRFQFLADQFHGADVGDRPVVGSTTAESVDH